MVIGLPIVVVTSEHVSTGGITNILGKKKGLCHRCMTQPPCYDVINDLLFFLDLATHDQVSRGSGDEHGGEGADDDTEDHGEGEALDAGAAEEEDDHQNDERRY